MTFNPGDKGRLKGGKQTMIVEQDTFADVLSVPREPPSVPCVWELPRGGFKRDRFQLTSLELVAPPAPPKEREAPPPTRRIPS